MVFVVLNVVNVPIDDAVDELVEEALGEVVTTGGVVNEAVEGAAYEVMIVLMEETLLLPVAVPIGLDLWVL